MTDQRSEEAKLYRRWYATKAWKDRRLAQLRAEPLCRFCEAQGIVTAATVVDHVVEHRGDYELFFAGDLQSLCKQHHDSTKQRMEKTGEALVIFDLDGYPIEITTPKGSRKLP